MADRKPVTHVLGALNELAATDVLNVSTGIIAATPGSTPSSPAAGSLRQYPTSVAGKVTPSWLGPTGPETVAQALLGRQSVGVWMPQGNNVTVPAVFGLTALTAQGTATARAVATTSLATRMRRIGYPSTAVAGTFSGARVGVAQFSSGSGTANDGSGSAAQTATAIGTGIGAPGGNSTTAWELVIYCPSGTAAAFNLQLTNLTTKVTASTTLSGAATVVPQSTTLLAWRHYSTNNAAAAAVGVDISSLYFETDY